MNWQKVTSLPLVASGHHARKPGAAAHLLARESGRSRQRRRPRHPRWQRRLRRLLLVAAVGIPESACLGSPCQHPPVIALASIYPAGSSACSQPCRLCASPFVSLPGANATPVFVRLVCSSTNPLQATTYTYVLGFLPPAMGSIRVTPVTRRQIVSILEMRGVHTC